MVLLFSLRLQVAYALQQILSKGLFGGYGDPAAMDYPKLRPVEALPTQNNMICLRDPQGFSDKLLLIPPPLFFVVSLFDGSHSVLDIQAEYTSRFGELLFSEKVREIIERLDDALFLESEHFQQARVQAVEQFRSAVVRAASHAGVSYEAQPETLTGQLQALFADPEAPGLPDTSSPTGRLRGLIAPHIDLPRGGACFARSYAELARECTARTFVILGIAHVPTKHPFALTAKDFQTPLGKVVTDRDFLGLLETFCKTDFYEDEFCHRSEHSVEFQVLFLQHLYGHEDRLRIVPILCSFPPELYLGGAISVHSEIEEFVQALSKTLAKHGSGVCCIAGVDLSHIGQRFGQNLELSPELLREVETKDRAMINTILSGDEEAFFRGIQEEQDRRNVCGVPAIYTLLRVIAAEEGKLLRYEQAVDPATQSVVSFMAGAFYGDRNP
ncbi:MAG: AmmeMemoRadiSam system protein B [Spirochaetaceae bacterium]|nr:MAG: AmmeMemoRadiSam system protein B [Spirochaetaceae bacterium]